MLHTAYEGDELDGMPTGGIFNLHEDSEIYAVVEYQPSPVSNVLGLCYREHRGSPLITKVRFKDEELREKSSLRVACETPEQAVEAFNGLLAQFGNGNGNGHVLTPDHNRGRYAAFCRMMECEPLGRS